MLLSCAVLVSLAGGAQLALAERSPFAQGEHATYRAAWGVFGRAGNATLTVAPDTLHGAASLRATFVVKGGIPGARVDERLESWMHPSTLVSMRFLQRTRYPGFSRDRLRDFDPVGRRWTGHTNARADSGALPTSRPIDELSAVLLARTLPLRVGEEVTLIDYWRPESNPVILKVLRRETVTVPAGRFETIVVRPIIRSSSLFAEKGEAEVYLSDGPRRELVKLRAKLGPATLTLQLERFESQSP